MKILKAHYVNLTGNVPPKIHDLVRLAILSDLNISEENIEFFETVNDFQLELRYPDERFEFYKKCTKEFENIYN